MSPLDRFFSRAFLAAAALACAFLIWGALARAHRVEAVSALEGAPRAADARSLTGFAGGERSLILPERSEDSFDWIAQTELMFSRRDLRVRHVDYADAPAGRPVSAPSPYRWWLGSLAWVGHAATGRPLGACVEAAALYSDPLLLLLGLVAMTVFTARVFGGWSAAVVALGLVTLFPLGSGFLPGMPDQRGSVELIGMGSTLLLVAGVSAPDFSRRRRFAAAGFLAGLGLWLSPAATVPLLLGTAAGGLLAAWLRDRTGKMPIPWRLWATSGGVTVLLAYLAEYLPGQLATLDLERVHPAYGVALIGLGEGLAVATSWIQGNRARAGMVLAARVLLAAAAVALVPILMWRTGSHGFLAKDLLWARLSRLPGGAVDAGTMAWLSHPGSGPAGWATLLPLLAVVPAAAILVRPAALRETRMGLAVALGPVVVAAGFATQRLEWWSACDAALLVLAAVALTAKDGAGVLRFRLAATAAVAAAAVAGLVQLWPPAPPGRDLGLTSQEARELIDRHLAHWLVQRAGTGGLVVFAPPHETSSLVFFGDLRGVGDFAPDNRAGFEATLGIAAARTMEEARSALAAHGVRYVVIPSWDPFFDEFGRRYLDPRFASRRSFLVDELRRWNPPAWLRPVPYQLPVGGDFADQSVLVFEVVEDQGAAAAGGRLAEYLVETGRLDEAEGVADGLRRFPGDVGALAARAQVQNARGNTTAAGETMASIYTRLSTGADRYLPWDRRVSLAVVLAQAGRSDQSRDQVRRCLADLNEPRLRSLSAGSLYALLELAHLFGLEIPDPAFRELAPTLLPGDLRNRL
jgi:hypothetical protein